MKTETWITTLAIIVLITVGIYWWMNNDSVAPPTTDEQPTYIEDIDGEEVVLDYPLVESLSNQSSNTKTASSDTTPYKTTTTSTISSSVGQTLLKPFIFGWYFFNNLKESGIEKCKGKQIPGGQARPDFPEYNDSNFELTDIKVKDKQAYLYVDAESPEGVCAYISQYQSIHNDVLDAIHVIVE